MENLDASRLLEKAERIEQAIELLDDEIFDDQFEFKGSEYQTISGAYDYHVVFPFGFQLLDQLRDLANECRAGAERRSTAN